MNYRRFVALRQEACDEFARRLEEARRRRPGYEDLEELARRYRQMLHDHALAAARFPGTAMARRLERLVLAGTHYLQRDPGDHLPSLRRFVGSSFPRAMRRTLPAIGVAAGLFAVAALFGFALVLVDPTLGTVFLPPDAIQGLEGGRLWTESIFAVTPPEVASSRIATNNLSVAMTAWAGGALAGLGALYILFLNGLMLGAVLATTARYSVADRLLEFIAAHGPLEISMILVSAAAGLGIGRALVVATDEPRAALVRRAGRDALVVILGVLPWILVLGFVEGYVSPSVDVAVEAKVALGLLLEAFFILFAWNPFRTPEAAS